MPMPSKVIRVEIAAHAHATEDVDRVKQAILNIIPEALHSKVEFAIHTLEGHYSNPITRIMVRLEGEAAEEFVRGLAEKLDKESKKIIAMMLENRYDAKQGRFYLRFSKQDAFLGELRFYDGDDVIHVMINLRGTPRLEKAIKVLKELGLVS